MGFLNFKMDSVTAQNWSIKQYISTYTSFEGVIHRDKITWQMKMLLITIDFFQVFKIMLY